MKQSNTSASKGRFTHPPLHLLKSIKVLTVGLVTIFSISLKAQVTNVFPSTGNVGIGSTSPQTNLDVYLTSSTTATNTGVQITGWGNMIGATRDLLAIRSIITGFNVRNEFVVNNNGRVGIGVHPNAQGWFGHINLQTDNTSALNLIALTTNTQSSKILFSNTSSPRHMIADDYTTQNLLIQPGIGGAGSNILHVKGRLLIGNTTNNSVPNGSTLDWKMAVDGNIVAKKCVVQINQWSDDVFGESYKLTPLTEVEQFIKENKHLPEIPSEAEVCKEGVSLGEMNNLLLRKIEELTLHIIAQQKQIDELKNK